MLIALLIGAVCNSAVLFYFWRRLDLLKEKTKAELRQEWSKILLWSAIMMVAGAAIALVLFLKQN